MQILVIWPVLPAATVQEFYYRTEKILIHFMNCLEEIKNNSGVLHLEGVGHLNYFANILCPNLSLLVSRYFLLCLLEAISIGTVSTISKPSPVILARLRGLLLMSCILVIP